MSLPRGPFPGREAARLRKREPAHRATAHGALCGLRRWPASPEATLTDRPALQTLRSAAAATRRKVKAWAASL